MAASTEKAASSENESGAGSMASSQSGVSPALEMLLNSKFEDMSTQFGFFESRLDAIDKRLSVLDAIDKKLAKLDSIEQVHMDVKALTKQQVAEGNVIQGVAVKQAEVLKVVNKMAGTVGDTQKRILEVKNSNKSSLDAIVKRLSALDTLDQKLAKLEQKTMGSGGVEHKQAALRGGSKATTAAAANSEEEVDRPTLDSKLDAMAERIQGIEEGITNMSSANTASSTSIAALDEKVAGLSEVAPKISSMHSNLELLLTGESEATGLIDKVGLPRTTSF